MTAQTQLAKASPLFDRSTPAKLGRSVMFMWLLVVIASAFFVFSWQEQHSRIQSLSQQALPSVVGGYNLMADFQAMAGAAQAEFQDNNTAAKTAANDYNRWRDNAETDLDSVLHIKVVPGPLTWSSDKPNAQQAALFAKLKAAFTNYGDDVNAAQVLRDGGNVQAAQEKLAASTDEMNTILYPAARALFDSGHDTFKQTVAAYQSWHSLLEKGTGAVAAVLFAFICWQYAFILIRGNRAILQGTILTLLLAGAVSGYAYEGMKGVDLHVQRAVVEIFPTMAANAKLEQLIARPVNSAQLGADVQSVQVRQASFETETIKAEGGIRYLLAAPFLLLLGGLFYKHAVSRCLKDYR
jgi:hypothetical protein